MAISISHVGKVTITKGTEGGDTYEVRMRGEMEKKKLCYRKVIDPRDIFDMEMRCEKVAGFGTDHVGTGACKFHSNDRAGTTTLSHGRTATKTRHLH